ncbi:MAG: TIGR02266 family protein [Desulfuromonadales bacterium]|nr:TIGR02266 family protein [Desulfuromonadales bacterium]
MPEEQPPSYAAQQADLRLNLRRPLLVERIPCEDTQKTFFGYAKNLSRGGLFVATLKPRQPGDEFILEMTLPIREPLALRCRCEVVWTRNFRRKSPLEPGMGLRFLDLTEEVAARIDEWVRGESP